jgi:hypothetical protein
MSTGTIPSPWTKKATSGEGGDFELPPSGSHPAVLVGMIDLGTHDQTFSGETKEQHKILLVWELTGEFTTKGETFKVSKDFTFSLNVKAKLRAFLEGWMGRKFGDDEEIDIAQFLTRECVLNLTEGTSKGGKAFIDVASATKPMKSLAVPPRTVEPILWTFDGWNANDEPPVPEWVPMLYGRKVADDVKNSKEWGTLSPF